MSSTITIQSRCHEAKGTWVQEPGSPQYQRDLWAAEERAERKTTRTRRKVGTPKS